jgi:hypothetical protein
MTFRQMLIALAAVGIASAAVVEIAPWNDARGQGAAPPAPLANGFGPDNRAPLSQAKSAIGFSDADAARANACTGILICEHVTAIVPQGRQCPQGSDPISPTECATLQAASASLICPPGQRRQDGTCVANTIATVAHVFIAIDAPGVKEEQCFFQTWPVPHQGAGVAAADIASLALPTPIGNVSPAIINAPPQQFLQERGEDRAFLRLMTPIAGCNPYDLTPADQTPARGDTIVMLTQRQLGQDPTRFDDSQPVAYPCSVVSQWKVSNASPTIYFTNCVADQAASGGAALVRAKSGDWTLAAILSGIVRTFGITFQVGTDGKAAVSPAP